MTELDKSGQHAAESEFRAWNPRNPRDVIYLEQPELIKYHPNHQLQRRDENGKWDTFLLSTADDGDTHQEDLED